MSKRIPLEGKQFNKLYVKEYIGNGKYNCICECGNKCIVSGTNLKRNHTTSCGCNKLVDLAGKEFGFLRVIKKAESKKRGKVKRTQYECICLICGNHKIVYADCLISGQTTSCGCLAKNKEMPETIKKEFVKGTQISKIQSKKTKANKSGVVGVNWDKSRGLWQASIRFKRHKYNLGRYADFEEACEIRKKAEEAIFGDFLQQYKNKFK